jgi:SAM-dependent methyltransferase
MSEPRSITFDRIADRYDETRGGLFRGNDFANAIAPRLAPGSLVVEPGVGTGAIALPLTERGFDVVGCDLAPAMLERAHGRLGNRVALADVQRLPIRSGAAGGVVTVWVLHVVARPEHLVAEIARILRPGGRWCAISADAVHEPDDIVAVKQSLDLALGRYRDAPDRVEAWAARAGFTLLERTTTTPWAHHQSPADLVRDMESRVWSGCWDLTDEQWDAIVVPAIDALMALPEPHHPRQRVASHPLQLFELQ